MRTALRSLCFLVPAFMLAACAANSTPETDISPVVAGNRAQEGMLQQYTDSYLTTGDDHIRMTKVVAPGPVVWDALVGAFADRKVTNTVMSRTAGRIGDTSMVLLRRFAGNTLSTYLKCGANMTGQRADEDRIRANLLGQITRLQADTVAIAVHFSGFATPLNAGGTASTAACTSTGRLEGEILDDIVRRVGVAATKKT